MVTCLGLNGHIDAIWHYRNVNNNNIWRELQIIIFWLRDFL